LRIRGKEKQRRRKQTPNAEIAETGKLIRKPGIEEMGSLKEKARAGLAFSDGVATSEHWERSEFQLRSGEAECEFTIRENQFGVVLVVLASEADLGFA
jgi:hypothetical protein